MSQPAPRPPSTSVLSRAVGILTLGWSNRPGPRSRLRRLASGSARLALRARARLILPRALGQVLVVAPHPDDETIGCGGLLSLLAEAGLVPHVAVVTDGAASHPNHPSLRPEQLAEIRSSEFGRSAAALGLPPDAVTFLGAADGTLAALGPAQQGELIDRLTRVLARVRPDVVLLPNRDDGSSEHEASFDLVREALRRSPGSVRVLEFPIWAWLNPQRLLRPLLGTGIIWRVDISSVLAAKLGAVNFYASQVRPIQPDTAPALSEEFLAEFRRPEEFFFER